MIILKNLAKYFAIFSILLIFSLNANAQAEGKQIFNSACIACHNLPGGGKSVGPDPNEWIKSERFVNEDDPTQTLIKYVQNPAAFGVVTMPSQPYTADEIIDVLKFVDEYVPEVKTVNAIIEIDEDVDGMSTNFILLLIVVSLLLLVFLLSSVKNSLKESLSQSTESVFGSIFKFANININKFIIGFVFFILILKLTYNLMMGVGVVEKYQPPQPIAFSHTVHAGENGVDCNYCHSSARKSKHSGVPSANVCMNCHAVVRGNTDLAKSEIGKIWESFGLDVDKDDFDWNKVDSYEKTPIEWIRVHNLPDLTYFNHSQHVSVGGLECQQCHGNMQEKTVGQVATSAELNDIEFNKKDSIVFDHPTLTMGWCIDCHRQKSVNMEDNDYYTEMHGKLKDIHGDKKITVDMIGGLECGKCHY